MKFAFHTLYLYKKVAYDMQCAQLVGYYLCLWSQNSWRPGPGKLLFHQASHFILVHRPLSTSGQVKWDSYTRKSVFPAVQNYWSQVLCCFVCCIELPCCGLS